MWMQLTAVWFVSCSCLRMMKFCHKNYVKKHVLFFCSVVDDSCWITMNWRCVSKQNAFLVFCALGLTFWTKNSLGVAISWSCLILMKYGKLIRFCKFVMNMKLCLPSLINTLCISVLWNITDVYLDLFHCHWVYKHDVSKADCFRLQVKVVI
jgi:hypothetical protein